ncbi:sensor histidine kinase KdpD [Cellulophaga sp. Hel_I_12]|uniref:sensor histidine kinase n=1 Tax=Cellulophaga sp. Hel_I_12 TaxID=1249972 RepID=UPI000646C783|nr:HAMP domain-containing sensor histidine kinase [Cellulophaga sp. Hel_I_12]
MLAKKKVYILVFIISVLGLLTVQYRYLKIGIGLASVQFSKKIDIARESITKELSEYNSLTYSIGRMLERDTTNLDIGLDSLRSMNQFYLNDYISYQLKISGIDTDFSYNLYARDSTVYLTSKVYHSKNNDVSLYPIKVGGYLSKLVEKELILELGFKDIENYFLFQLNGLTIPGILFLLAIITVVIWVLRSFYWQSTLITTTNEFINNLTHELKTPVFSISLATKILEEGGYSEREAVLKLIRREIVRLKKHIEKVLDLASLESGKMIMQPVKLDFRPELQRICEDFEILAQYENIDFTYELENKPYAILADVFHLENAIRNLLDNAKKYSDTPIIRLHAYLREGQMLITISDNGIGIEKADLERIFKKYYRVKNNDLHFVKGYGLGLTYVQRIVRINGGKIKVKSELGKGTTFIIILKLIKSKFNV